MFAKFERYRSICRYSVGANLYTYAPTTAVHLVKRQKFQIGFEIESWHHLRWGSGAHAHNVYSYGPERVLAEDKTSNFK